MPGVNPPQAKVQLGIKVDCSSPQDFVTVGFASCRLTAHVKDVKAAGGALRLSSAQMAGRDLDVVWEVREARNRGSVAPGWETMPSGLSWSAPVSSRTTPVEGLWTRTDESASSTAQLFDILGERTVTVCASVMSDGVRGGACTTVEFGKGPLSRFMKPSSSPVSYKEHLAFCQSRNAAMPDVADLQAIAQKGRYNKLPQAYGAALAAGWKTSERYWAGILPMMKNRARHASLVDGNPHGSGGVSTETGRQYGIYLRPGA